MSNDKIGSCIKERGNWGKLKPEFRFDNKLFDTKVFLKHLHQASPKLETLLNKIQELDAKDIAEHGKLFKHFIYSDIKSAYGAKLIAAGLSAYGFDHAYNLKAGARGMSFTLDKSVIGNKNTFATLTSVAFFEKPIGVQFRKELLKLFNARPDNIQGNQIRIIVLDSGFREGIDLFDIKYVHLFEPISTYSDQKQAIGRATRFCGQKGLQFDPHAGWPIQVYRYETIIPDEIKDFIIRQRPELAPSNNFFELFLKFSNIDPKKIQLANELEQVTTNVAVDRAFTKNIHQFRIEPVKSVGGSSLGKHFEKFQAMIEKKYHSYVWPPVKIENMCGGASIVSFSPTQDFVRHYFTPKYPNPGMLLYHSVGTGKCHAKDTPILMYDGSIKMVQNIEIGDLLMGDDSTPRKVLSLAQGIDEMYDIIPVKGDKYTVNSEHILVLKNNSNYIANREKSQPNKPYCANYFDNKKIAKLTKTFKTREEAETFLNKYKSDDKQIIEISVKDYLNLAPSLRKGLKGFRKGVEFKYKDVPLDPYFIGVWLGDGSSRTSKFTTADEIILNYMTKEVEKFGLNVKHEKNYDYRISGNGKVGNNFIMNTLIKYNLLNNKHIPSDYLVNSRENRLRLLAGLIDTNGHYDSKGKVYEITQKSNILAENILFLARSLGFAAYSKKSGIYNRICISGNILEIPVMIPYKKATTRLQKKDVLLTGVDVVSVGEGKYYGFTLDGNNRYLLGDFTVTHNTCSAIATASSSFEANDYTILYVTRYTLKGDVWKNMFDQVCNVILQDKLTKGVKLPDSQAARLRLISKGWFEPMSYRQFSNMLAGKNKLSQELIARNGTKDPLHKTLIIIDEAHKLFAADVEGQEKADIDVIRNALQHSNKVSQQDGAKILLMTGTPYTDDPMDMIRLLNLCRPNNDKIPESFESFATEFLDEQGHFTEDGRLKFLDKYTGYISYLNREKDVRSFSYPIFHEIQVAMSDYEYIDLIHPFLQLKITYKHRLEDLQRNKEVAAQDLQLLRKRLEQNLLELMKTRNEQYKLCLKELKLSQADKLKEILKKYNSKVKECKNEVKVGQKDVREDYKLMIKSVREELREELKGHTKEEKVQLRREAKRQIERIKLEQEYDIEQVINQPEHKSCINNAVQEYENDVQRMSTPRTKEECELIKQRNDIIEADIRASNEDIIEEREHDNIEKYELDKRVVKSLETRYKEINTELNQKMSQDISQRTGLENCLGNKITPAYKFLLTGDSILSPSNGESQTEPSLNSSQVQNIYLISGHGNEIVQPFKNRLTMPSDKVLIVFPVCSRPNYLDKICRFIKDIKDPKNNALFRNPIKYRRKITTLINQPIRIYLPGENVPNLSTNLFLDFVQENTVLAKSGVYRIQNIPEIKRDILPPAENTKEKLGSPLCIPLSGIISKPSHYNSKIHREVFSGNIYKPAAIRDTFEHLKYRKFNVMNIMEDVGPGIYYYIGCRSSQDNIKPEQYLQIIEASEEQQERTARTKKISPVLKHIRGVKSSESSSSSSLSSSSIEKSSEDIKPKKKTHEPDNNKDERKVLKEIYEEVQQTIELFENVPEKIKDWKERLTPILQTKRYEKVFENVELIEHLYESRSMATDELKVSLDKDFHRLDIVASLIVKGRRRYFNRRIYGYIPVQMKNTDIKCSTNVLIMRIKKLYKKNVILHILPKTKEEWTNKDLVFESICQVVSKKLLVSK